PPAWDSGRRPSRLRQWSPSRRPHLLFGDFDNFASLILAAMRADAVGDLGLVAIGAFRLRGPPQAVMCPAFTRAGCGVSSFRIRHSGTSKFLPHQRILSTRVFILVPLQVAQCAPAVICRLHRAVAGRFIAVLPANRANALAVLAANPLH